jgi:hypothetical protein
VEDDFAKLLKEIQPSQRVIELAWDTVLELFEHKHSKPTCRSWLSNTVITRMQRICDGNVVTLLCRQYRQS